MSTVTLVIPEEIDKELANLSVRREEFFLQAIKEKIQSQKNSNLEELLAEGYKERRIENKLLNKEFFYTDLENWNEY